jgi:aerobic-type carbon monoxide dehydrogenase small subunit (CoxS/CutS family)
MTFRARWNNTIAKSRGTKIGTGKMDRTSKQSIIKLIINGRDYEFKVGHGPADIEPSHTLAHTLRNTVGLTGTKVGCDHGACGACTVIMDGEPILSCITLTVECHGKSISTVEGLSVSKTGKLDPIQESFIDRTAFQCGFCTPGMIMTARAFLDKNPFPTEEEIKDALSGNHCRCISYYHIVDAVLAAAKKGVSDQDA